MTSIRDKWLTPITGTIYIDGLEDYMAKEQEKKIIATGELTSFTQDDYDDGITTMVGKIGDEFFEQRWAICTFKTRDGKTTGWEQDAWYKVMEHVTDPMARLSILRSMAEQIDGPKLEVAK